jgi:hypothetical protein
MDRDKALNAARAVVQAGWDVEVYGSAERGNQVMRVIGDMRPEHWNVAVTHQSTISVDDLIALRELVDVLHLDVYFNPTGRGFWLQEAP